MQAPRAKEFLQLLRSRVSDKRASHCIFTAEFLSSFAEKAGIPHDKAVTAGLLHDLWKDADGNLLLDKAHEFGIEITELHRKKPSLLHGPVAAEDARRNLGIKDDDIYEAIRWHATGRPGLCVLGQALYLADFSEPLRAFPEAKEGRELLRVEGFLRALKYVARAKIDHIRNKAQIVDPISEAFCEWLEATYPS